MSTPVRLALYVVGLLALLGAGVVVGRLLDLDAPAASIAPAVRAAIAAPDAALRRAVA